MDDFWGAEKTFREVDGALRKLQVVMADLGIQ